MITFVPILTWIMIYFTWWFTKVEYEYRIEEGVLTARRIYGERYCQTLCRVPLTALSACLPLSKGMDAGIPRSRQIWCCSSAHAPALYVLRFEEHGSPCLLILELSDQARRILHVVE